MSVNTANNQVSGFSYDAAGNLQNDTSHSYTYDAEGNMVAVDGGSTAKYGYDASYHRVRFDIWGGSFEELYNLSGQKVVIWNAGSESVVEEDTHLGTQPLAVYLSGSLFFEHQDWLGTERLLTDGAGHTAGSYLSLPFGDGFTDQGTDLDPYHFAGMDHDYESGLDHAQFREYSSAGGRWLSPDPYSGSYDWSNPQSLNRYAYALNNPLSMSDPTGEDGCGDYINWGDEVGGAFGFIDSSDYWVSQTGGDWTSDDSSLISGITADPPSTTPAATPDCPPTTCTTVNVHDVLLPLPSIVYPSINASFGFSWSTGGGGGSGADLTVLKKIGSCLVDSTLNHYGLTAAAGASGALAIPISKSLVPPFRMIGEPTTNLFSVLGYYARVNVPRIAIAGRESANLFRIVGRANPYAAGALLAIDVGMISYDTYQCYQKQ